MTTELEVIQAWLQSCYSVQVPADWLAACTEWIQQENGGQPMSAAQLQPMVFEQWLMSDLKELEAVCLPADLPMLLSTHLKGPFALQVESMVDVGLPLYGQLQKVKGTMNANSEVSADRPYQPAWEPKPSRMMLLKMTDGQTEIQGMEYRPIAALGGNLQPGFKVVVHGQVTCRRGVLMLTADNLQVLGGEVDSLVEANTPVAVLEHAMETNSANNGKHAKKEFSGRFINKQDFKLGVSGQKKCKVETTVSTLQQPGYCRPSPGSSQAGGQKWCRNVKKEPLGKREPLAPQNTVTMDDEWEEDLDYGGILHTFDEPMEEVSNNIPSASHTTSNVAASQLSGAGGSSKQPLSVSSSSAVAKPSASWQSSTSNPHTSSARPTNRASTLNSSASRFGQDRASFSIKDEQRDGSLELAAGSGVGDGKMWAQAPSVPTRKSSAAEVDDSMWGEDDDFVLAQADADFLSPVTPVQSHFTAGPQSAGTSNSSSSAACRAGDSSMLENPGGIKTADPCSSPGFPWTSGNPPNKTADPCSSPGFPWTSGNPPNKTADPCSSPGFPWTSGNPPNKTADPCSSPGFPWTSGNPPNKTADPCSSPGFPWTSGNPPNKTADPCSSPGFPWTSGNPPNKTADPCSSPGFPWTSGNPPNKTADPCSSPGFPWTSGNPPNKTADPCSSPGFPWTSGNPPNKTADPCSSPGFPWTSGNPPNKTADPCSSPGFPWTSGNPPNKTADPCSSPGFPWTSGNPPNGKGGTNCFNTALQSTKVRSAPSSSLFSRDSSKSTFPTTAPNSSCSSSAETEPPLPKQRKLTSMLSTMKKETKAEVGSTCLPEAVIDLTSDSPSPASGGGCFSVKQGRNDLSSAAVCKSPDTVASPIGCRDGQNMGTMDHSDEDVHPLQTTVAAQNENLPKAVIAPFSSQGTPDAASRSHQPLKDVQSWVQSGSDGEQSFAVKGYITTLTDRLRSGKGDNWSLSCRITDGTDTMEVVISDKVLSHLIGFSAEESITLRQQARKDPKVKDYLTKGLQKCQKALIEFSGLIDLHVTAGDAKPVITNMIQLEKKIR